MIMTPLSSRSDIVVIVVVLLLLLLFFLWGCQSLQRSSRR